LTPTIFTRVVPSGVESGHFGISHHSLDEYTNHGDSMSNSTRDKIVDMVRKMRDNTIDKGCTPGEAAKFAAKVAELIEKYQIDEAELRVEGGGSADDVEVVENTLGTGKKVHNPGMTAIIHGLARGVCCEVILIPAGYKGRKDAAYGIIGDQMDADYVCQIACLVHPALHIMATMDGKEHGHEKASLVRWNNQYMVGAAGEIKKRLETERQRRSDERRAQWELDNPGKNANAIVLVTGNSLAIVKKQSAKEAMAKLYPQTRQTRSRQQFDPTAQELGRQAGRNVGLDLQID
jgi:hypothetical protein